MYTHYHYWSIIIRYAHYIHYWTCIYIYIHVCIHVYIYIYTHIPEIPLLCPLLALAWLSWIQVAIRWNCCCSGHRTTSGPLHALRDARGWGIRGKGLGTPRAWAFWSILSYCRKKSTDVNRINRKNGHLYLRIRVVMIITIITIIITTGIIQNSSNTNTHHNNNNNNNNDKDM